MKEILFYVSMGLISVASVVAIVCLIILIARQNKVNKARGKVVVIDGAAYELVPLGQEPTASAVQPAAVQPVAAQPAAVQPAAEQSAQPEEVIAEESAETSPAEEGRDIESEAEDEDSQNVVVLRRNEKVSYPDAYAALSEEQRGYIDDILAHAEEKEGVKKVVNDRSASIYLGKKLVVRTLVKRGEVYARLTVQNNDFCAYTDNAGLNVKEKPIDIKVEDAELVSAVKDIIDISYRDLSAERARREEQKKALRREQRRLARERAKAQAESETVEEVAFSSEEAPAAELAEEE